MKYFLLLFSLLSFSGLFGQQEKNLNYSWNTYPTNNIEDTIKPVNGQVIKLERRIHDIYLNEDNYFEQIEIFHKKTSVLTSDALNYNNKIYIGMNGVLEILKVRARFISPQGKITEIPEAKLVKMENLDNKGDYNSFVIEGAEVGGEIEYFYIVRKKFKAYNGYRLQSEIPKSDILIRYFYDPKLEYMVSSYNGLPEFTKEEGEEFKSLSLDVPYIRGIHEEPYSFYESNLMRYEICLSHNNYKSSTRKYSFNKAADNLYSGMMNPGKKEIKALQKILKQQDDASLPLKSRIRKLEDYIKTNIHASDEISSLEIDQGIKLRQNSSYGLTRTFVNLFELAGIDYELVLTSKRDNRRFDPNFNAYNFLDEYLLFFPGIGEVLVPDDPGFRLGLFPYNYHGSYGLFMKPFVYNEDIKSFSTEVKQLPWPEYSENSDTIIAHLCLNENFTEIEARVHRSFSGLDGQNFQSFWYLIDKEKEKEIVSQVCNMGSEEIKIDNYQVSNYNETDIAIRPFCIDLEHKAGSLLEFAGNDIIFKIGESIGAQSELYQTEKRMLPVEIDILRNYYRKIVFEIPDGYEIKNAENLNTYVDLKINAKTGCMFSSEYRIENGKLIIISKEYYSDHHYPVERFEEFRKVINAAADFNKIDIILKPI